MKIANLYFLYLFIILVLGALSVRAYAQQQVPPHAPGTVCFTPTFWCWALQPGPPGSPCACPVQNGYVNGTLG